jgi:hypothetical protein
VALAFVLVVDGWVASVVLVVELDEVLDVGDEVWVWVGDVVVAGALATESVTRSPRLRLPVGDTLATVPGSYSPVVTGFVDTLSPRLRSVADTSSAGLPR